MSDYYNKELFKVCRIGNEERLKEMIDDGIDINQINNNKENCLFDACLYGHKEIVEILIREGVYIHQVNVLGENCLFYHCFNRNKDIIKLLIKEGIEIQDKIYKSNIIEEDIKRYVKELKIKREIREKYI